jgi:ComF family protein
MLRVLPRAGACEVCRSWGPGRLCPTCLERFAPPLPRCARCGLRTALPLPTCGGCLSDPPPWRSTTCAVDYGFPWDQLIARFKFQGQAELAGPLAQLMQQGLRPEVQALLPVPLAPSRLAERGYNQAWELARQLAAALGLPARADVLLRPLATPAQAQLTRAERQRNLRAAFMVAPEHRAWLQGRSVALVDDVMTTGATAREATAVLLRAGAASVDLWMLARTPATRAACLDPSVQEGR